MAENIDLALNLDAQGFISSANQAAAASGTLGNSFGAIERATQKLGNTLVGTTGVTKMFGPAPLRMAAQFESQLSSMQATAAVTGQSMGRLQASMASLARTYPIGNRGAAEVVSTLQSMGYAGKAQIGTIDNLGRAYTRLGMATGQNASVIGRQMTMLSRAFGAADSDTVRFRKMSDSLTTVTAKIGGSSSDILAFSKNIAPMARSAGIGQTAVMGISAAFSKMGEDGFAASNAMNKMLMDLNRSVRDGSGEMGTYANIVGKTRKEFEALFKNDPTKALSLLTENLGGGGKASERNLERIGLDGPRTARVLQGLSQQGGIGRAAQTAVAAYGDQSTARAAKAATDGVNDAFNTLTSATEQATEALGRPFLGALTDIINLTSKPIKGAAAALNNETVQTVLRYAVPLMGAYMAARGLQALGFGSALARNVAVNNGVIRGFREGAQQSYNTGAVTGPMTQARADGRLGNMGMYGRATGAAISMGQGFGQAREDYRLNRLLQQGVPLMQATQQARMPSTGPGLGSRLGSMLGAVPRTALWAASRVQDVVNRGYQENANLLREDDPTQRRSRSLLRPRYANPVAPGVYGPQGPALGRVGRLGEQMRDAWGGRDQTGPVGAGGASGWQGLKNTVTSAGAAAGAAAKTMPSIATAMRNMGRESVNSAGMVQRASTMVVKSLHNTAMGLRALGQTAMATGIPQRAGGALVGAAKGLMSPMMLGMMGSAFAIQKWTADKDERKQEMTSHASRSISGTIDEYRNSMGAATDATQTFADQVRTATEALMRTVTTSAEARKITDADVSYARQTKDKIQNEYLGTNASVAEQLRAASPRGLKPQDEQAIKVDLLRQRSRQDVDQIMGGLNGGGNGQVDYSSVFGGEVGKDRSAAGGWTGFRRGLFGQDGYDDTGMGRFGTVLGAASGISLVTEGLERFTPFDDSKVGSGYNKAKISKGQQVALNTVSEGIATKATDDEQNYGADYSRQEQARAMNEAFKSAAATGNADLIARVSQQLSEDLGGMRNSTTISADQAKDAGGFIQAFRDQNKWAKENLTGVDLNPNNGTAGVERKLTDDAVTKATDGIALFGTALSNRATDVNTAGNKLVKAFLDAPGDMDKFRAALDGLTAEGTRTGMSLNQVGAAALSTVKALGDATSDASRLATAVFERSVQTNEEQAGFQGRAATGRRRMQFGRDLIDSADSTQEGQQRYERGRGMIMQQREADRQVFVQRLEQQRQFEKMSSRANRDYELQLSYTHADFEKNRARQAQQFGIQRGRQERDFNLGMLHAQEDFATARLRAHRDFNKQIVRANEDAAKSMYAPFERMQVQAVSDLGVLMVNLAEQNVAMQRQAENLRKARSIGVSNDVIDQLGLNKSENAQQLEELLGDLAEKAANPQALNAMIAERMKAAGVLASDSSQVDRRRGREDFEQSLKDQDQEFTKSIKRNKAAYAQGVKDMVADYQRGLRQQEADFNQMLDRQKKAFDTQLNDQVVDIKDSQKEILGSYEELAAATQNAMSGKAGAFKDLMHDTMQATVDDALAFAQKYPDVFASVAAAYPDQLPKAGQKTKAQVDYEERIAADADRAKRYRNVPEGDGLGLGGYDASTVPDIPGQPPQVDHMMHLVRSGMGKNIALNSGFRPGAITATGNPSYHGQGRAVDLPPSMEVFRWIKANYPHSKELIFSPAGGAQLHNGGEHMYTGVTRQNHFDHVHWAMAKGGIAKSTPGGLNTTLAEAGSNEAVIPLNTQGVAVLAQAMTQYMTGPDMQRMMSAQHGDRVTYTGNTFIEDHSTSVSGPITVMADDPNAMMRALQAKARAANLSSTPTRKSS